MTRLHPRSALDSAQSPRRLHLLTLPYDIRFLIYQHLCPPGPQLYLQATPSRLCCISPDVYVPLSLFLTNRQLNREASEFLYNDYLFNILGTKRDCLATYAVFEETVRKYAWKEVHVDAFSNGAHSATMCISVHVGDGKTDFIMRRDRGVRRSIKEVRMEIGGPEAGETSSVMSIMWRGLRQGGTIVWIGTAVLIAVLAWMVMMAGDSWSGDTRS